MGSSVSRKNASCHEGEENTEMFCNFEIPDDLLIDVLSFVPSNDLITHCRLVCKLWKEIIDGHGLWKIKCEREKKYFPSLKFEKIPLHYYRMIYIHNPYGINLIQNPSGENGMNDWIITHSGGDGLTVEDPPNGADPVPAEVGSTKCFATSYLPSEKHQVIDLVARGIHPDVIDCSKTKIEIGEWYAARFDCASFYKLDVFLLDGNYPGTETWEDCIVDHFTFEYREEQWVGKEWHKVNHVFENVAKSRFIYFEHHGKDCQFWAGHYGSKMTGAYAKVVI
ncbi:F-box only protein 27 [Parasteatoda tepidariorum]|uniref:F-box only protein 27 n=1 Tax=Parasteatoda tepidariorum TaxID=114398 RepID=UPI00077F9EB7|nr:F-box only protein 27 [Parasteatoda tepidariorum]